VRQRRLRDFIPTQSIERKSVVSSRLSLIRRPDRRRSEGIEILRGLIERVAVSAAEGGFTIELVGEIANMVELSSGPEGRKVGPYRSSVKVVAGARNHREFPICVAL
jgi:hypothetical protein